MRRFITILFDFFYSKLSKRFATTGNNAIEPDVFGFPAAAARLRFFFLASLAAYLCASAGCVSGKNTGGDEFVANPNARFTPVLNGRIVNRYGAASETELCEIVFSRTADMQKPFKRFRLYRNEEFSLEEFAAGEEFYIGAFIDLDGDLSPTYGSEPVGGAYAEIAMGLCVSAEFNFTEREKVSEYKIVIKGDRPTAVEIKMLRPITGRAPANGAIGLTTRPRFDWSPVTGIANYKITVYNDETAGDYWQAVSYSTGITYSVLNAGGDREMFSAKLLPANKRHKWSLAGYDSGGELWAYGPGLTFLP